MLPRVADSLSFLYLDMVRLVQDDTGVCAQIQVNDARTDTVYVPTASLTCLLLGPGVSVTTRALTTLARHGTSVVCTGSGGVRAYAGILPDSLTTHWLEQQVHAWADPDQRLDVAIRMYEKRFDDDVPDGTTIAQLRGMEGQRIKALYRILADQHGVGRFRRNYHPDQWHTQDPVNLALSAANTCLYGIVHAALLALGYSPALGFVHAGTQHAFVYDIADLYKAETTLPIAFSLNQSAAPDAEARRKFREGLRLFRLLPRIVADIQALLTPGGPDQDEEHSERRDVDMVHLWDPKAGVLPAGVNYGPPRRRGGVPPSQMRGGLVGSSSPPARGCSDL
ncbi:type I-E CRISPR-associated endonuclease Cas1e [Streptomyces sp. H27-D2]|uniref:type I-E CRISPR-associated endonuclease Cas1e n=1 Tax=Streptomyces sp. H27-D2 TaxID=3046304 RepID=UPI002DBC6E3F|nr:type I-E CRISPR-associated endonuclease Cas1e [Streptomyces sp. H27-D2]MEC4020490.1 type I-E CRISPR-associated endonuclease Cas1e [Streptomyces sp. H27-D2]